MRFTLQPDDIDSKEKDQAARKLFGDDAVDELVGSDSNELMSKEEFEQEIEQARRRKDDERLAELEQLASRGGVADV